MASLKAQGFRTGVSDIVLAFPVSPYHGAYIELKRRDAKPSDVSADQRAWLRLMASVGYWVYVAKGADAFVSAVTQYLSGQEQPALDFALAVEVK